MHDGAASFLPFPFSAATGVLSPNWETNENYSQNIGNQDSDGSAAVFSHNTGTLASHEGPLSLFHVQMCAASAWCALTLKKGGVKRAYLLTFQELDA